MIPLTRIAREMIARQDASARVGGEQPSAVRVDPVSTARSWGVVVRLADGRRLFWCAPSSRRSGQDQWGPRDTQALRFTTQEEAQRVAAQFETNAAAKEYLVVQL